MWLIKLIPTAVTLALCQSLMQHLFEVQIGVKLCGEFCKNFCGCKHFRHSPVFLRCILLLSRCRKSGLAEVQKTNDTEKLVVFRRMTTRTHGQVWVQIDVDNQDLNKEQVGRKMIIAMQFISRLELGLFDPSKPTLRYRPHGHCRANVVSCILHVKILNMVLVADRKRGIIKKVLLKKKLCIDSKMKVKCPDMKLHGRLQRVFMIGENNVRKFPVYSMTVDGSELRHEFNIKGHRHLMNIALDETKDLIYASGFHVIVSFTLQGHNGTVIATDLEQTRISLDPTGSIVYFTQHKSVFKLNTATREAEELIKCPEFTFKFSNIELFFGKIFISSWSSPVYGIIDVKLKTCKRMEMERTYLTGIRIARPA